jgi:cephalosporin hydroxylase
MKPCREGATVWRVALLLLLRACTGDGVALKIPLRSLGLGDDVAVIADHDIQVPEEEYDAICARVEAMTPNSNCTAFLLSTVARGRAAVRGTISPLGLRIGVGNVAPCLHYDTSLPSIAQDRTVVKRCGKFYALDADMEFETLRGHKIFRDEILFMADKLYEHGQLGTRELCENCGGLFSKTKWRGIPIQSAPNDLFVLQEIVHERTPDVIIESGTAYGGSAIFYASHLDESGLVITIDIHGLRDGCFGPQISSEEEGRGSGGEGRGSGRCRRAQENSLWSRVRPLRGRSDDPAILKEVKRVLRGWALVHGREPKVMLSLDGPHFCDDVLGEIAGLAPFVTSGQYAVVQDTKMDHMYVHWLDTEYYGGRGPLCAVHRFFEEMPELARDFVVDRRREYLGSQHQQGWLLKM